MIVIADATSSASSVARSRAGRMVLSGETTFVRARATAPSTVLRVSGDALRELMVTDSELGDLAGDVRFGSMKRVAAAVGEGSSAIRSVHEFLAPSGH